MARTLVSLMISTTAGRPEASALSRAGLIPPGSSTRIPKAPESSAIFAKETPFSNLLVSIANKYDCEIDKFGLSNGRVAL